MCDKIRLDVILKNNFGFSREHAKEVIEKGYVSLDGKILKKPGEKFLASTEIHVDKSGFLKYVGRGGLKLEKALEVFNIDLKNKVCADIGASTGGFTDCMLQNGAEKVFAIDVGTNQLADKLKCNPNVISLENTNIKDLAAEDIGGQVDFASVDVSFVSVTKILSYVSDIVLNCGGIVVLIKPQFEAGKHNIGKNGIVKDIKIHRNVIKSIYLYCMEIGLGIVDLTSSPIRGSEGNIEYLIYLSKSDKGMDFFKFSEIMERVVLQVFKDF